MVAACSALMQQSPSENEKTFSFWGLRPQTHTGTLPPFTEWDYVYHRSTMYCIIDGLLKRKHKACITCGETNTCSLSFIYYYKIDLIDICDKIWAFLNTPFLLKCALSVVKNARTDTHKLKKSPGGNTPGPLIGRGLYPLPHPSASRPPAVCSRCQPLKIRPLSRSLKN